jgi:hypothetical protein
MFETLADATTLRPSWLKTFFVYDYRNPDENVIVVKRPGHTRGGWIKLHTLCNVFNLTKLKSNQGFLPGVWQSTIDQLRSTNSVAKVLNDCNSDNRFILWDGDSAFSPHRNSKLTYHTIDAFMRFYVKDNQQAESDKFLEFFSVLAGKLVEHDHYTGILNIYMGAHLSERIQPEPLERVGLHGECSICYNDDKFLVPVCVSAGHVVCIDCLPGIQNNQCPMCRGNIVVLDVKSMRDISLANYAHFTRNPVQCPQVTAELQQAKDELKKSQDELKKSQDELKQQEETNRSLKRKLGAIREQTVY